MESRRFFFAERIGAAPRIEPGVPHRFAGVDVADSRDTRLVQQEFLERAARGSKKAGEVPRSEFFREGINTQGFETCTIFSGFEKMNAAEVTAIGKTEDAAVEFEGHVDVDVVMRHVSFGQEIFR